jgi:pyrophosphatase PpaX
MSIRPYPGMLGVLEFFGRHGIKQAICSSRHTNLLMTLKAAEVMPHIHVVVEGNQVIHHKPHRDPVDLTLKKLDTTPKRAIMIGDSPVDIQAAQSADVRHTIGVTWGFGTGRQLRAENPTHVVNSVSQLSVKLTRLVLASRRPT